MNAGNGNNNNGENGGSKLFFSDLDLKKGGAASGRAPTPAKPQSSMPGYASGIGFDFEDDEEEEERSGFDVMRNTNSWEESSTAPESSSEYNLDEADEILPPPEAELRAEYKDESEEISDDEDLLELDSFDNQESFKLAARKQASHKAPSSDKFGTAGKSVATDQNLISEIPSMPEEALAKPTQQNAEQIAGSSEATPNENPVPEDLDDIMRDSAASIGIPEAREAKAKNIEATETDNEDDEDAALDEMLKEASAFADGEDSDGIPGLTATGSDEETIENEPGKTDRVLSIPSAPGEIKRKRKATSRSASAEQPEDEDIAAEDSLEQNTLSDSEAESSAEEAVNSEQPEEEPQSATTEAEKKAYESSMKETALEIPAVPGERNATKSSSDANISEDFEQEEFEQAPADANIANKEDGTSGGTGFESDQKGGADSEAAVATPDGGIDPVPLDPDQAPPPEPQKEEPQDAWGALLETAREQSAPKPKKAESFGSGLRDMGEEATSPGEESSDSVLGDLSDILKQGTASAFGDDNWEEEIPAVPLEAQEEEEEEEEEQEKAPKPDFKEIAKKVFQQLKANVKAIAHNLDHKFHWKENWRMTMLVLTAVILTVCAALWIGYWLSIYTG